MPVHNYSISLPLDLFKPEITEACYNFCRELFVIHNNNLGIELLFLPAVALLSLIIHQIIRDHKEYGKWSYNAVKFSKGLLILFFILFFYRYYL